MASKLKVGELEWARVGTSGQKWAEWAGRPGRLVSVSTYTHTQIRKKREMATEIPQPKKDTFAY